MSVVEPPKGADSPKKAASPKAQHKKVGKSFEVLDEEAEPGAGPDKDASAPLSFPPLPSDQPHIAGAKRALQFMIDDFQTLFGTDKDVAQHIENTLKDFRKKISQIGLALSNANPSISDKAVLDSARLLDNYDHIKKEFLAARAKAAVSVSPVLPAGSASVNPLGGAPPVPPPKPKIASMPPSAKKEGSLAGGVVAPSLVASVPAAADKYQKSDADLITKLGTAKGEDIQKTFLQIVDRLKAIGATNPTDYMKLLKEFSEKLVSGDPNSPIKNLQNFYATPAAPDGGAAEKKASGERSAAYQALAAINDKWIKSFVAPKDSGQLDELAGIVGKLLSLSDTAKGNIFQDNVRDALNIQLKTQVKTSVTVTPLPTPSGPAHPVQPAQPAQPLPSLPVVDPTKAAKTAWMKKEFENVKKMPFMEEKIRYQEYLFQRLRKDGYHTVDSVQLENEIDAAIAYLKSLPQEKLLPDNLQAARDLREILYETAKKLNYKKGLDEIATIPASPLMDIDKTKLPNYAAYNNSMDLWMADSQQKYFKAYQEKVLAPWIREVENNPGQSDKLDTYLGKLQSMIEFLPPSVTGIQVPARVEVLDKQVMALNRILKNDNIKFNAKQLETMRQIVNSLKAQGIQNLSEVDAAIAQKQGKPAPKAQDLSDALLRINANGIQPGLPPTPGSPVVRLSARVKQPEPYPIPQLIARDTPPQPGGPIKAVVPTYKLPQAKPLSSETQEKKQLFDRLANGIIDNLSTIPLGPPGQKPIEPPYEYLKGNTLNLELGKPKCSLQKNNGTEDYVATVSQDPKEARAAFGAILSSFKKEFPQEKDVNLAVADVNILKELVKETFLQGSNPVFMKDAEAAIAASPYKTKDAFLAKVQEELVAELPAPHPPGVEP